MADDAIRKRVMEVLKQCVAKLSEPRTDDIRKLILSIETRIQVYVDRIDIFLNPINLPRWLDRTDGDAEPSATTQSDIDGLVTLTIPIRLKRVGNEMKMIVEDGSHPEKPNRSLVRALVRAHVIRDRMLADKTLTV